VIWATAYNAVAIPMAAGITFGTGFLMTPAVGAGLMFGEHDHRGHQRAVASVLSEERLSLRTFQR
jgi:hypothetical protein